MDLEMLISLPTFLKMRILQWIVGNKDSKMKVMKEEMRLMEMRALMSAQQQRSVPREENTVSASDYAKARAKAAYFQSQVAALTEQLQEAKQTYMEAQLADHAHFEAVGFHSNSRLVTYMLGCVKEIVG